MYNRIYLIDTITHHNTPLGNFAAGVEMSLEDMNELIFGYTVDLEPSEHLYMFFVKKVKKYLHLIGMVKRTNDYPYLTTNPKIEGITGAGVVLIINRLMNQTRVRRSPFVINGEILVVNDPKDIPADSQLPIHSYM